MAFHVLNGDRKPVIFPYPRRCVWTGDIYECGKELLIAADACFSEEARLFLEMLWRHGFSAAMCDGSRYDVMLRKSASGLEPEAYSLRISEDAICLEAGDPRGALYGLMSLLQLVIHAAGDSLPGVVIEDAPAAKRRVAVVSGTSEMDDRGMLERFADVCLKYKLNGVAFPWALDPMAAALFKRRHIDILASDSPAPEESIEIPLREISETEIYKALYPLIKRADVLWNGRDPSIYGVTPFCEGVRKLIAQMLPMERALLGTGRVTRKKTRNAALDLRSWYNAQAYRLCWGYDYCDYDFLFLAEDDYTPGPVHFSLFQGVFDERTDYGMILAGDNWCDGGRGIPVDRMADSVWFLHSSIPRDTPPEPGAIVGRYRFLYDDGTEAEMIVKEQSHVARSGFIDSLSWVTDAIPAYVGYTRQGNPYALFASEWINPFPGKKIRSLDIMPDKADSHGIAVLAMTTTRREPEHGG